MDRGDLDALVARLYDELNLDPLDPPPMAEIARRWLRPGQRHASAVRRAHLVGAPSSILRVDGVVTVFVRHGVPEEYVPFWIGHELGHLLDFDRGDDAEARADYLSAGLMMPREAVRVFYRAEGFDPKLLAEATEATQTAAALRIAEVEVLPLAAVTPAIVRVRGPESFVWGDEQAIRVEASRRKMRSGLVRVRLTDQPRRVALLADDGERDG